jgi:pantetheine-phosphate adenylyltransferase
MPTKIVYPGTFDPLTNGHLDLIQRAAKLFAQVVVAIATHSSAKQTLLTVTERVTLAQGATRHLPNVQVVSFAGLLVDCLEQQHSTLLLRGVRNSSEFDSELQRAMMNHRLCSRVQTLFLTPAPEWLFLSSSLVKEISRHGGQIDQFLPSPIAAAVAAKLQTL